MIYLILSILLIIAIFLCVKLYKQQRKNEKKVEFLFNSINIGDYGFSFPDKNDDERPLNILLNRVKEILEHAREEQIQREQYYELILSSIDTGILVVDEERELILQYNQAAKRLLGRNILTHIQQIKKHLSDFSIHESHTTLKGRNVKILAISDIHSELAKQEAESWTKLIRVLTHEVMNTLTPIISLSDALIEGSDDTQRESLQVIHQTSQELIHFVETYRKATLIPQPQFKAFYVKPFLERMAKLIEPTSLSDTIPSDSFIRIHVKPEGLMVYADESLLARVVSNLLKNATQANAQHISIQAYTDSSESVMIDIANDGEPIPEDVVSHIFVPFFTTKKDGNGIGLSISRQIMGMNNGTINLVKDSSQEQTIFRLTFN